jgi:hypothetical protein
VMSTSNSILLAFFLHLPELSTPRSPNLMRQQQHSTIASSFSVDAGARVFRSPSRVAATTKRGADAQCQIQQVCKIANPLTSWQKTSTDEDKAKSKEAQGIKILGFWAEDFDHPFRVLRGFICAEEKAEVRV